MTKVLLIRHGQTDWNLEGRWQGQADVPLNPRGLKQASELAQRIIQQKLDAIYSSDLQRAYQTAQAIASLTNLPVNLDPRLREIDQGEWEGMLIKDIQERYATQLQQRRSNPEAIAPPGGESGGKVQERVLEAIQHIVFQHPEQRVAVVSHGFAIATARVHYVGWSFDKVWELVPHNSEIVELEIPSQSNLTN